MKTTFFFLSLLFLFSCQQADSEKTISVKDLYSISIPSSLVKSSNLNQEASLQYQNGREELYVIVIDESKESFEKALVDNKLTNRYSMDLQGYADLLLDGFKRSIHATDQPNMKDTLINDNPAKVVTLSGKPDDIDIHYAIAYIKGKNRYYQVMTWTLESKKDQHQEKMHRMLHSFKELRQGKEM